MKKIMLIISLSVINVIYAYPFTVPYFDEEFFLYPFLNYDQSSEWKRSREGNLYSGGFVQTSHGSQTTWLLMSREEAVINQNAGEKFVFRFRYKNMESRHLSYSEDISSAGLGYRLSDRFTLMLETDLESKKEIIDLKPGILFNFQTVYAYFGISFDDFLFDIKNLGDGVNNSLPLTISTDIRFLFNRLYFFISGNYGTGIDRTWPDGPYTDRLMHKNHIRNLYTRIEYDITDNIRLYQENYFDEFYDAKRLKPIATWDSIPADTSLHIPAHWDWVDHEPEISEYDFKAKMFNIRLGGIWAIDEKNSIEPGISYARTEHEFELVDGQALVNDHAKSYTIDYPALLPYVIYKYRIHTKFTAELSYMGCYTASNDNNNLYYVRLGENYWDKDLVKIGFEYRFSPNCSLYISAGQLVNTNVFGGGNARFNLTF
jgi:hypothetical protein